MQPQRIETVPKLPPRPIDGQKGMFGTVLVVGGSNDMIGAPILAGTAALRCGSGLVQVALPHAVLAAALSITPELIGLGLDDHGRDNDALSKAATKATVVIMGPGLGQQEATKQRIDLLIAMDKPMVIDADALNLLAAGKQWPTNFRAKAVLTPHPGEMKRLNALLGKGDVPTDDEGRIALAMEAAQKFKVVMLLKGHRTVVTDGQRVYLNQTGDSSLSKAGAGDVLRGVIGSLLGQKMDHFEATCLGAHLHGRAGELAGQKLGRRSVLARDVIDALPAAIAELEKK